MFHTLQYFGIIHLLMWPHLSHSTTHWVVTENGMVHSKVNSPMHMKRPWDLVEWLRQEERATLVHQIDSKMSEFKQEESELTVEALNVFVDHYHVTHHWCVSANKKFKQLDLYQPVVVTPLQKHINQYSALLKPKSESYWKEQGKLLQPNCEKISALDFSINAFEHLESMKNRHKLVSYAEVYIYKKVVPPEYTVDQLGHQLHLSLQKNSSSWVLFTLASFYWRIKGAAPASVECLRRALHHCPRTYSDIPLVALAGLLHLAKETKDAIVLMRAAQSVALSSDYRVMLGNMLAVRGDYDGAVIEFESVLHAPVSRAFRIEIQQKMKTVLCQRDLENAIDEKQRKIAQTLETYKSYANSYERIRWKLLAEEADTSVQIQSEYFFELSVTLEREHLYCRTNERGEKICPRNFPIPIRPVNADYQMQIQAMISKNAHSIHLEQIKKDETDEQLKQMQSLQLIDYTNPIRPALYPTMQPPLESTHPLMNDTLPASHECKSYISTLGPADYPSVYLPPENKGFEVHTLLGENLGILPSEEHELPWYPPQCITMLDLDTESDRYYDHLIGMKDRFKLVQSPLLYRQLEDPAAERILKQLARRGQASPDDVGQRIFTAMKQKSGPDWLLFNLAGLYWRSKGQLFYGMECQRRALHTVPDIYRDVPLMNLAAMFHQWKRYSDAVMVSGDALGVSETEPVSHLFYGALLSGSGDWVNSMRHWRLAVRQDRSLGDEPCTHSIEHWCVPELIMRTRCEIARESRFQIMRRNSSVSQVDTPPVNKGKKNESKTPVPVVLVEKKPRATRNIDQLIMDSVCDLFVKYEIVKYEEECPFPYQVFDYGSALPHIKIVKTSGNVLMHALIWFSQSKLYPEESECFVFNDTSRTNGCTLETSLYRASDRIIHFLNDCLSVLANPHILAKSSSELLQDDVSDKSLDSLIVSRHLLDRPNLEQCSNMKKINFTMFTSTLLTLEAKGVNVKSILKQVEVVDSNWTNMPICKPPLGQKHWLFELFTKHKVWDVAETYVYESSLQEPFLDMANGEFDMERLAVIIATGHKANTSDWIMANLAGLYWRIRGDSRNAHQCFIIAYDNSPMDSKDVTLIGVANIAFQLKKLHLAIHLTRLALKLSPQTVIAHFTMANLFAAQGNYYWAFKFYEATLGLQKTFQPAIQRMRALQCMEVVKSQESNKSPPSPLKP